MPVNYGGVPFKEAIDHLKNKLNVTTEYWDDMLGPPHAKSFTVAGANQLAIVEDIHSSLIKLAKEGGTLTDFRKDFDQIVQEYGWPYKGKRGWRTAIIFNTNMRTAHMAGKWAQIQRVKKLRPYLQYKIVKDGRTRDEHKEWSDWVLHVDDVWWDTHYPPNGWGCRCSVRSLSEKQVKQMGLEVRKSPPIELETRSNSATGETYPDTPKGIDAGWDYNVGKAWLASDTYFGEQVLKLGNQTIRTDLLNRAAREFTKPADANFKRFIKAQITKRDAGQGDTNNIIKTAGFLSGDAVKKLIGLGVVPISAAITIRDREALHVIRDSNRSKNRVRKDTDKRHSIDDEHAMDLTDIMRSPDAIILDTEDQALLYIRKIKGAYIKVVVKLNMSSKTKHNNKREKLNSNYVRSAGMVQKRDLMHSRYKIIEGSL